MLMISDLVGSEDVFNVKDLAHLVVSYQSQHMY